MALPLWLRDSVKPAADTPTGGSEIGFKPGDAAQIQQTFEAWQA